MKRYVEIYPACGTAQRSGSRPLLIENKISCIAEVMGG
jgi:hypothetical protein